MMNEFVLNILRKVRFFVCLPFLLFIALVTMPLTLIFKWNGFWILYIACKEWCSISSAQTLLGKGKKYQVVYRNGGAYCCNTLDSDFSDHYSGVFTHSQADSFRPIESSLDDYQTSPSYSFLPYNIHHNDK
jgi:hypothetical protein